MSTWLGAKTFLQDVAPENFESIGDNYGGLRELFNLSLQAYQRIEPPEELRSFHGQMARELILKLGRLARTASVARSGNKAEQGRGHASVLMGSLGVIRRTPRALGFSNTSRRK